MKRQKTPQWTRKQLKQLIRDICTHESDRRHGRYATKDENDVVDQLNQRISEALGEEVN